MACWAGYILHLLPAMATAIIAGVRLIRIVLISAAVGCFVTEFSARAQTAQTRQQQLASCSQTTDTDRTIAGCTGVIQSNSEVPQVRAAALSNRGVAHESRGEKDKALVDYLEAIRLSPNSRAAVSAHINIANIYREDGKPDRAIMEYDDALRLDSSNSQALNNRRLVYQSISAGSIQPGQYLPGFISGGEVTFNPRLCRSGSASNGRITSSALMSFTLMSVWKCQ